MRVLVATDGSACSEAAVEEIARRPWPEGTEMRVISIVEVPLAPTTEVWALPLNYYDEIEKTLTDRAEAAVARASRRLGENEARGLTISSAISTGAPKNVILD